MLLRRPQSQLSEVVGRVKAQMPVVVQELMWRQWED
jgi:hypothetical protein